MSAVFHTTTVWGFAWDWVLQLKRRVLDDHLDFYTILDLWKYHERTIHFFVPLGQCHVPL